MSAGSTTGGIAGDCRIRDHRIRNHRAGDEVGVFSVNAAAFATQDEARLVERLGEVATPLVSIVAEGSDGIVGHILFSPVDLDGAPDLKFMGLAPMAVVPERQKTGIGSELVRAGLQACLDMGVGAVVVLGHAEYYPRFGFVPASTVGVGCEYEVPDNAFMIMELIPGYLDGRRGIARYHAAFSQLG